MKRLLNARLLVGTLFFAVCTQGICDSPASVALLQGIDTATGLVRDQCVFGSSVPAKPPEPFKFASAVHFKQGSTLEEYMKDTQSQGGVDFLSKTLSLGGQVSDSQQEKTSRYADYLIAERVTVQQEDPPRLQVQLSDAGKQAAKGGPIEFFATCGDVFLNGHTHGSQIQARWSSENLTQSEWDSFSGKVAGNFADLIKGAFANKESSLRQLQQQTMEGEIVSVGAPAAVLPQSILDVIKAVNIFNPAVQADMGWTSQSYIGSGIAGIPAMTDEARGKIQALQGIGRSADAVAKALQRNLADSLYAKDHPHEFGDPQDAVVDPLTSGIKRELEQLRDSLNSCYHSKSATSVDCVSVSKQQPPARFPDRGESISAALTNMLRLVPDTIPYQTSPCWKLVAVRGAYMHYTPTPWQTTNQYSTPGQTRLRLTYAGNSYTYDGVPDAVMLPPGAVLTFWGTNYKTDMTSDYAQRYTHANDHPLPQNPLRVMVFNPIRAADFTNAKCPPGFQCPVTYPPDSRLEPGCTR